MSSRVSWASSPAARNVMRGNRSRDTKPELALRRALHASGLRFRVGIRPEPGLRRTADIVFTRQRIAVFVDGCFWHGCPKHFVAPRANHGYWGPKIDANRERDRDTTRRLEGAGWTVIRIWEHTPLDIATTCVIETHRNLQTIGGRRHIP